MERKKSQTLSRRLAGAAVRAAAGVLLLAVASVLILRFVPPPTSAFMAARSLQGWVDPRARKAVDYQWVAWEDISPWMGLAAVAAEDQKFPYHLGFDFEAIAEAIDDLEEGGPVRGASTISQQVAKNLFLWQGKSFARKGLEAGVTVLIELMWPKRRILEIYLNIAEFGEGIYGVKTASKRFFGKTAAQLTRHEAALLAAVLPNPARFKAAAPSTYVKLRTLKIEKQMSNLGPSYLKDI